MRFSLIRKIRVFFQNKKYIRSGLATLYSSAQQGSRVSKHLFQAGPRLVSKWVPATFQKRRKNVPAGLGGFGGFSGVFGKVRQGVGGFGKVQKKLQKLYDCSTASKSVRKFSRVPRLDGFNMFEKVQEGSGVFENGPRWFKEFRKTSIHFGGFRMVQLGFVWFKRIKEVSGGSMGF